MRDERRCEEEEVERRHEERAGVRDWKGSRTKGRVGVVGSDYQRGTSMDSTGEEMRGTVNIGVLVSSNPLLFINFTSLIH